MVSYRTARSARPIELVGGPLPSLPLPPCLMEMDSISGISFLPSCSLAAPTITATGRDPSPTAAWFFVPSTLLWPSKPTRAPPLWQGRFGCRRRGSPCPLRSSSTPSPPWRPSLSSRPLHFPLLQLPPGRDVVPVLFRQVVPWDPCLEDVEDGVEWLGSPKLDSVDTYVRLIRSLNVEIRTLSDELKRMAPNDEDVRLLMTIPGVGY